MSKDSNPLAWSQWCARIFWVVALVGCQEVELPRTDAQSSPSASAKDEKSKTAIENDVSKLRVAGPRLSANEGPQIRAAAVHEGRLLCLIADGTIQAWDLKTGAYSKKDSTRLSQNGLVGLAADGDRLWAADQSVVYRWSLKTDAWEKIGDVDAGGEKLFGIAVVGGAPLLVFPSLVADPVRGKSFRIPKPDGTPLDGLQGPPLRILAIHGMDSRLWIGTGRGEWGGCLFGLDPKTGQWFYDVRLAYNVTGFAHAVQSEVIVSCSLSHFGEHTRVRIYNLDASLKTSHDDLNSKYYQALAFSSYDKALYGIESSDLVTIANGKPIKVVKLDGRLHEREPNAMGVAPAVIAIIPIGPKTLVIVPKMGEPWLLRDGALTRLSMP